MVPLLAHGAATWTMTGMIWFVQLVHYPLFRMVGTESFTAYEAEHQRRTAAMIAVPAIVEVATAGWLFLVPPAGVSRWLPFAGGLVLVGIWLTTALVQVPLHGRLGEGFDANAAKRLVASNWTRTMAWSMRAVLATIMIAAAS